MPATKHVRRSVSLPGPLAKQVDRIAKSERSSDNRVLVELIEMGIEARKQREKAFFELAERFRNASDPKEAKRLGDEMGLMVFKDLMRKNAGTSPSPGAMSEALHFCKSDTLFSSQTCVTNATDSQPAMRDNEKSR